MEVGGWCVGGVGGCAGKVLAGRWCLASNRVGERGSGSL